MKAYEINPWKTHSSREIYRNPWLRLREDQVTRPDGKPGIYSVIETRVATGVVAVDADDQIYLVGQYRYPTEVYTWEIPEGGAELGEDPLVAIKRELREEAGVTAAHWEPLSHEIHLSNCMSAERTFIYLAKNLTITDSEPDGTEVIQVKKLHLSECLEMIERGEIVDAMTIMGLLLYERRCR